MRHACAAIVCIFHIINLNQNCIGAFPIKRHSSSCWSRRSETAGKIILIFSLCGRRLLPRFRPRCASCPLLRPSLGVRRQFPAAARRFPRPALCPWRPLGGRILSGLLMCSRIFLRLTLSSRQPLPFLPRLTTCAWNGGRRRHPGQGSIFRPAGRPGRRAGRGGRPVRRRGGWRRSGFCLRP